MASGVGVHDEVKTLFCKMKVVSSSDDQCERKRVVTFTIQNDCIAVESVYHEKDLVGKDVFLFFKDLLEYGKCRYILYDCHFSTKESSVKEELILVTWCCDQAKIKEKMIYTSSKQSLLGVLKGVKHNMQMNEPSDCGDRNCFAAKLGGNLLTLEGHEVQPEISASCTTQYTQHKH